eukprot:SAG11_NODE_128_length_15542_cov_6.432105_1_plen_137_part_00
MNNWCEMTDRLDIPWMGYSMRTPDFRCAFHFDSPITVALRAYARRLHLLPLSLRPSTAGAVRTLPVLLPLSTARAVLPVGAQIRNGHAGMGRPSAPIGVYPRVLSCTITVATTEALPLASTTTRTWCVLVACWPID